MSYSVGPLLPTFVRTLGLSCRNHPHDHTSLGSGHSSDSSVSDVVLEPPPSLSLLDPDFLQFLTFRYPKFVHWSVLNELTRKKKGKHFTLHPPSYYRGVYPGTGIGVFDTYAIQWVISQPISLICESLLFLYLLE